MMYNEQLLGYLQKAVAKPLWSEDKAQVFSAEAGIKDSGAWLKLYCHIEGNTILDLRYRVLGSGYLIATAEWANAVLTGKSVAAAQSLNASCVIEALNLPPTRVYCAQMLVDVITKIIRQAI